MEKVTHMILVTDPSRKGTEVIKSIKKVADELVMYKEIGVVINRLSDERQKEFINVGELPILAYIKEDEELKLADIKGESVLNLDDNANIVKGVDETLKALKIIE